MTDKPRSQAKPPAPSRDDRLKAALKANMARRKAQARARADQTDPGETAAAEKDEAE